MAKSIAIYRQTGSTTTRKVRDVTRVNDTRANDMVTYENWHYVPKGVHRRNKNDAAKQAFKNQMQLNKLKLVERLKKERESKKKI